MRLRLEQARLVRAPCEPVFEAVLDQESLPAFTRGHGLVPAVAYVEIVGSDRLEVGVVRKVRFTRFGGYDEVITLLDRGPDWRLGYRVVGGFSFPLSPFARGGEGEYAVDSVPEGCRLTWTASVDLRSPLAWPPGWLFRGLFVHRAMRGYLDGVAAAVERAG